MLEGRTSSYSEEQAILRQPIEHNVRMEPLKTLALFVATALAEIVGCYLPYLWLKQGQAVLGFWFLPPPAWRCLRGCSPSNRRGRLTCLWWAHIGVGAILWLWADKVVPSPSHWVGVRHGHHQEFGPRNVGPLEKAALHGVVPAVDGLGGSG